MVAFPVSILALLCLSLSCHAKPALKHSMEKPDAYVTLLYADWYLLPVRVLGQSLRESGTAKEMVALVTGPISQATETTLLQDGWKVKKVDLVRNPGLGPQKYGYPKQFWAVYTKLQVFNLTEYGKVAYIDADTIVTKNCDVLFECSGFCAVLRHSERLNSGVLVVTPSAARFSDMMQKVGTLPSYTGGDQGFLNSYFSDFAKSPLFEPGLKQPEGTTMMRLPTTFNADVGLYVVNSNRWNVPRNTIHVVHYTFGPFKPWMWWSSWLVDEAASWQAVRRRLPADAFGHEGGHTTMQVAACVWMLLVPPVATLAVWLRGAAMNKRLLAIARPLVDAPRLASPWRSMRGSSAGGDKDPLSAAYVGRGIALGLTSVAVAVLPAALLVPTEIVPEWGWLLAYEWGLWVLSTLLLARLTACRREGESLAVRKGPAKVGAPPWRETCAAATLCYALLIAAPWSSRILGVKSFTGTVLCTAISGGAALALLTAAFVWLPLLWWRSACLPDHWL